MSKDKNINIFSSGLAIGATCITGAGLYYVLHKYKKPPRSSRPKTPPPSPASSCVSPSEFKTSDSLVITIPPSPSHSHSPSLHSPQTPLTPSPLTHTELKLIETVYKKKLIKIVEDKRKELEVPLQDVSLESPKRKISDDLYFKLLDSPEELSPITSDEESDWVRIQDVNHLKSNS